MKISIKDILLVKTHQILVKSGVICQGVYGPCYHFGKKRRQNTMYNDDSLNWVVMCDRCFKENEEYWEERWNEYYSGQGYYF